MKLLNTVISTLLQIVITLLLIGLLHVTGVVDWGWVTIAVATLFVVIAPWVIKELMTLYFIAEILFNRFRNSKRKDTK